MKVPSVAVYKVEILILVARFPGTGWMGQSASSEAAAGAPFTTGGGEGSDAGRPPHDAAQHGEAARPSHDEDEGNPPRGSAAAATEAAANAGLGAGGEVREGAYASAQPEAADPSSQVQAAEAATAGSAVLAPSRVLAPASHVLLAQIMGQLPPGVEPDGRQQHVQSSHASAAAVLDKARRFRSMVEGLLPGDASSFSSAVAAASAAAAAARGTTTGHSGTSRPASRSSSRPSSRTPSRTSSRAVSRSASFARDGVASAGNGALGIAKRSSRPGARQVVGARVVLSKSSTHGDAFVEASNAALLKQQSQRSADATTRRDGAAGGLKPAEPLIAMAAGAVHRLEAAWGTRFVRERREIPLEPFDVDGAMGDAAGTPHAHARAHAHVTAQHVTAMATEAAPAEGAAASSAAAAASASVAAVTAGNMDNMGNMGGGGGVDGHGGVVAAGHREPPQPPPQQLAPPPTTELWWGAPLKGTQPGTQRWSPPTLTPSGGWRLSRGDHSASGASLASLDSEAAIELAAAASPMPPPLPPGEPPPPRALLSPCEGGAAPGAGGGARPDGSDLASPMRHLNSWRLWSSPDRGAAAAQGGGIGTSMGAIIEERPSRPGSELGSPLLSPIRSPMVSSPLGSPFHSPMLTAHAPHHGAAPNGAAHGAAASTPAASAASTLHLRGSPMTTDSPVAADPAATDSLDPLDPHLPPIAQLPPAVVPAASPAAAVAAAAALSLVGGNDHIDRDGGAHVEAHPP